MKLKVTVIVDLLIPILINLVDCDCPMMYRIIDKQHSYCAKRISITSSLPTKSDIDQILDLHNRERTNVNGAYMQKMYWNSDIADIAQRYADHCDFRHDKSIQRQAPRIPLPTGQNLAMGYKDWTSVIQAWANEKKHFTYGSTIHTGAVGHYTQMVKDTATLVGCGFAICPKNKIDLHHDWSFFVCNYVTGQTDTSKPYELVNSLSMNSKRLYDCFGLICLYGGSPNINLCQCQCQSFASGKQCENLNCSSLSNNCIYGNDKSLCVQYSNIPIECPKFCGLCEQYTEMRNYYTSNGLRITKEILFTLVYQIEMFLFDYFFLFH